MDTNISDEHGASIFRGEGGETEPVPSLQQLLNCHFQDHSIFTTGRKPEYIIQAMTLFEPEDGAVCCPKHLYSPTRLAAVTTQKKTTRIMTIIKT
jgi:hypothetical protein